MPSEPRADTDPATVGDLRRLIKRIKKAEELISDAFEKISETDDRLTQNVDEAIERATRAQRVVNRIKKEWDAS